jgi:RNA polymerase sigma factor for flagellar operon FliA
VSTVSIYNEIESLSKENLIIQYAPMVKRIAHHLIGRLPKNIQVDDLIQAGMIGLLEAASKYDTSKGASFETYAGIRIRGTMLDEVRKNDWVPRSVYRNTRNMSEIVRMLENKLGRDARDTEIAEALQVSLEEYHQMLSDANLAQVYAFEDIGIPEENLSSVLLGTVPGPLEGIQREKFFAVLSENIKKLPEREQLVLSLYYDDELNLKEIGEILEVSESRVCQIHSQAMLRLRSRIGNWQ